MKKLPIVLLLFLGLSSFTGLNHTVSPHFAQTQNNLNNFSKPIYYSITKNGYTITVYGDLTWSPLSPTHFKFKGNVTISGPNNFWVTIPINESFLDEAGSVTIYSSEVDVDYNSANAEIATGAYWETTDVTTTDLLNDPDNVQAFVDEINN